MQSLPKISIIIVTFNSIRTIADCLFYIKKQKYPKIDEVLVIDGGSTDKTLELTKKSGLPIKIVKGGYPNNQEARRWVGIQHAKNEICISLDSDNFITDTRWLHDMVLPLVKHKDIIASQTLRYAAPRNTTFFNRYFGLIGAGDPVAYYLGKADRLSFAFDHWNLLGKVLSEYDTYYIVEFETNAFPTVGCNGIAFKRSVLLQADVKIPEDYIHTDVFVDVSKKGYNRFAIVKNEVFHNTAENIFSFFGKRLRYMKMYHQKMNIKRRHLTFDPHNKKDVILLLRFILFAGTIIEPLYEAIRGYIKKRDIAWFLHPVVTLGLAGIYAYATLTKGIKHATKPSRKKV